MSIEVMLLNIAVTALMYMAIPLCVIMYCWGFERKLTKKVINRIAILNALAVWLIVQVIKSSQVNESTSMAVLFWGYTSHWLLMKTCLKK